MLKFLLGGRVAQIVSARQPCSLAARKWRENKRMMRKWRGNEERFSLYIFPFSHYFLPLHFLYQKSYGTFCRIQCEKAPQVVRACLVGIVVKNLQLSILKIRNVKLKNQMFHLGGEGGGEEAAESNTAAVGDEQREEGDEPPKLLQKHVVHLPVDVFIS